VGYNAQIAVDAKHKLIAADDVTNEVNDLQQLANVALEARANLELTRTEVVADAGYYNGVGSQPVRRTRHHPVHSQERHQRQLRAWLYGRKTSSSMTPSRMSMSVRRATR